jgi:hypothetical protein
MQKKSISVLIQLFSALPLAISALSDFISSKFFVIAAGSRSISVLSQALPCRHNPFVDLQISFL